MIVKLIGGVAHGQEIVIDDERRGAVEMPVHSARGPLMMTMTYYRQQFYLPDDTPGIELLDFLPHATIEHPDDFIREEKRPYRLYTIFTTPAHKMYLEGKLKFLDERYREWLSARRAEKLTGLNPKVTGAFAAFCKIAVEGLTELLSQEKEA